MAFRRASRFPDLQFFPRGQLTDALPEDSDVDVFGKTFVLSRRTALRCSQLISLMAHVSRPRDLGFVFGTTPGIDRNVSPSAGRQVRLG
jgi:hypothetical protein